jgi:hypothetical protein
MPDKDHGKGLFGRMLGAIQTAVGLEQVLPICVGWRKAYGSPNACRGWSLCEVELPDEFGPEPLSL